VTGDVVRIIVGHGEARRSERIEVVPRAEWEAMSAAQRKDALGRMARAEAECTFASWAYPADVKDA
jgi:hypothetical protein